MLSTECMCAHVCVHMALNYSHLVSHVDQVVSDILHVKPAYQHLTRTMRASCTKKQLCQVDILSGGTYRELFSEDIILPKWMQAY